MLNKHSRFGAILLFAILLAWQLPNIRFVSVNDDYIDLLPRGDKNFDHYNEYLKHFPNDGGTMIILTLGRSLDSQTIDAISTVSDALLNIDEVERVISLASEKYVTGNRAGITLVPFPEIEITDEAQHCIRAYNYLPFQKMLVDKSCIHVILYVISRHESNAILLTQKINEILGEIQYNENFQEIEMFQSGETYVSSGLSRETARSNYLLIGVIVIMIITAYAVLRQKIITVLSVATGVLAVIMMTAAMGILGIEQNPVNSLTASIILPLGVAFAIHAHNYVLNDTQKIAGWLPKTAITPFIFATITTAIGFGSTGLSSIPALQQFGAFGVIGICSCAIIVFLLVFPLLANVSKHKNHFVENWNLPFVALSKNLTILSIVVIFTVAAIGIMQARVNYGPVDYLKKQHPAHRAFTDAKSIFGGSYIIPLMFRSRGEKLATDKYYQVRLHEFLTGYRDRIMPDLEHASLYKILGAVNLAFNDSIVKSVYPDSPLLAAQFLNLFEERDIDQYINWERNIGVILLRVPFKESSAFRKLEVDIEEFGKTSGIDLTLTGRVAQFFRAGDMIAENNVRSCAVGLILVFLVFAIFLRSIKLALLAIIPNILPVMSAIAILGYLKIDLDIGSSIVAAGALGIVVDDTGHFIARYKALRNEWPREHAVRRTVYELSRPIITTSIVIIVGISVMNLSGLIPYHTYSRVLSLTMVIALIGDLVLLPNLLLHFDKPRSSDRLYTREPWLKSVI